MREGMSQKEVDNLEPPERWCIYLHFELIYQHIPKLCCEASRPLCVDPHSAETHCPPSSTAQVFGLLVWMLITGTEYFHVPAFGWVMFVAVTYWVLTVFFLIMYLTNARARMPRVPWTTVFFAFLVALCYAVHAYFSYRAWASHGEHQ
ncbi:CKLF-like MARVEL transmembrane domain-containing protein 8 isoform X5 [Scleropages formosus]|uniref:CKLF-like MARVEL transmembrane domain-containing protein 8 isoform X5 n=1 Tax=Scleropages formosus TaxID=113540 RepID=UPI0010FACB60|nr:CKLF-like MARVEL transmembrane domain-containing protein 8 isoform X5 [Scleropages formosus]